ncbi:MAG: D-amino acid dehydrogenase [Alphaproteobacteria bacterium]|nr:D-amino acid dehydrogenase [Alphaproteobacteria bacterium]
MKVIVLGAGVIGVATAYYLHRDGHDVTVVDRQKGAGLETSFANGGQISSGHSAPWASPNAPLDILKSFGKEDAPLIFRLKADPQMWAWGVRFLQNCTPGRYHRNTLTNFRLAAHSRDETKRVRADTGIRYDHGSQGILHIFREPKLFERAAKRSEGFRAHGGDEKVLDRAAILKLEPALETARAPIIGGVHTVEDETGDAHKFTQALAAYLAARGVEFRYEATVTAIERADGRIARIVTDKGAVTGDAYALCLGSYTPFFTRALGFGIPVYPVKGYSTTVPVGGANRAPTMSVTDESRKVVVTRLGNRLRAAGTAEIAGYDLNLNRVRGEAVLAIVKELYPEGGEMDKAEFWCGLRPMSPDGPPILGKTPYANLFINVGHGTLGWTMACGSGHVLADVVGGKRPAIALDGLTLDRFG